MINLYTVYVYSQSVISYYLFYLHNDYIFAYMLVKPLSLPVAFPSQPILLLKYIRRFAFERTRYFYVFYTLLKER